MTQDFYSYTADKEMSAKEMLSAAAALFAKSNTPAGEEVCLLALAEIEKLERALEICRAVTKLCCEKRECGPKTPLKYLGKFLGFDVYEDPSLTDGQFRVMTDSQLTNEMLALEKYWRTPATPNEQEKTNGL